VAGNYFDVLALRVQLGRPIIPDDDVVGAAKAVVVLGDAIWRSRFGADRSVVGRSVQINGTSFTVVGVAEPGATDSALETLPPAAFLPMAALPLANPGDEFSRELMTSSHHCCVRVAGRLADGRSAAGAQTELALAHLDFSRTIGGATPESLARMGVSVTDTRLISQQESATLLPIFALVFAGMTLLLLLACANVGNLQLARALSRQREVSIRLALGASRRRVIRQLMTEGALLATGAGLVAVVVAWLVPPLILVQLTGGKDAAALDLSPDARLILFALGLSLSASVLFGLAPALRATRRLADSARTNRQTSGGRVPLRTALLAAQVAISTVLLIAAGLLVRGVVRASTFDPGFRTSDVLVASVQLPRDAYAPAARQAWYSAWQQALGQAGIGQVGSTSTVPLGGRNTSTSVRLPGESEEADRIVQMHNVSPGYFSVLDFRFAAGRPLEARDAGAGVVVNETLARLLWSTTDVVGRPFYAGRGIRNVVGVMSDAHVTSLDAVAPAFFELSVSGRPEVFVRDIAGARERLAALTAQLEPRAALSIKPLSENVDLALRDSRIGADIAIGVGLAGLVLAAMGAFGVFAYLVNERSREIGIRRAIGARGVDVAFLVFGRTGRALGVGLAVGLAAALLAAPALESKLYGLNPRDPLTFTLALAVLALAAVTATIIPLRRAMHIDPAITLRQD
jgi:predicted permease